MRKKHFEDKDKMGISHLPRVVGEIVPVERVVELAPVTAVIYKTRTNLAYFQQ